jgi:cold shock CspA family protein
MNATAKIIGTTALEAAFEAAKAKKQPSDESKALAKAVSESGAEIQRPSSERRHQRKLFDKKVSWGRHDFGTLTLGTEQFRIGREAEHGAYLWTRILKGDHTPSQMSIGFTASLPAGVRLLRAQGGELLDVTTGTIPPLPVVINWSGDGRRDGDLKPHTRRTDADNVDFVFLRKDGKFIQIQVSLVTRKGSFYICVQEVWGGQIVRTTLDRVQNLGFSYLTVAGAGGKSFGALVVPLFDDNAYPGADYLKTFKNMGPKVIECANKRGATSAFSDMVVAEWTPQEVDGLSQDMIDAGYKTGVVKFFNATVNYGFIEDSDGNNHFLYGDQIVESLDGPTLVSQGEFPVVEPMKGVVFKMGKGKDGKPQAVNVYQPQE